MERDKNSKQHRRVYTPPFTDHRYSEYTQSDYTHQSSTNWMHRLSRLRDNTAAVMSMTYLIHIGIISLFVVFIVASMIRAVFFWAGTTKSVYYPSTDAQAGTLTDFIIIIVSILAVIVFVRAAYLTHFESTTRYLYQKAWRLLTRYDTGQIVADTVFWERAYRIEDRKPNLNWFSLLRPNNIETQVTSAALNLTTLYEIARSIKDPGKLESNNSWRFFSSQPYSGLIAIPVFCGFISIPSVCMLLPIPIWLSIVLSNQQAYNTKILAICDYLLHKPDARFLCPKGESKELRGPDIERLLTSESDSADGIEQNTNVRQKKIKPGVPQYMAGDWDDDD